MTRSDDTGAGQPENGAMDPRDALFDATHLTQDLGARTGNAAIVLLVMSGLRILQQLLAVTVIARLIGPEEYGIFALAMPGVMLAVALSNFGLPQAIIQRPHVTHRLASTLFWLNSVFGVVATLAVATLAGWAAVFFDEPRVVPVFQVVSLSVLFSAMAGQYIAIMRRTLRVREVEIITLGAEFLGLGLAVAAALTGASYWALVVQQITVPLVTLAVLAVYTRWCPSWPDFAKLDGVGAALGFGGYVAGYSIVTRMTGYAGTVVTGRILGGAEVGIFYRTHNLATIPRLRVMTALSSAFVPALSRLQKDPTAFVTMYRRIVSRSCLVMLPIAVILAVGAPQITEVLLGAQWLSVAPLLAWMSLMTAIAPANLTLHYALLACGRSGALFAVSVVQLGVVVLALSLSATEGLVAMTAVFMLSELCVTLPLTIAVAVRMTPVTFGALARTALLEMAIAGAIVGLLAAAAPVWSGRHAILDLVILVGLVGCAYGVRISVDQGMRHDMSRAVFGRLRRRQT